MAPATATETSVLTAQEHIVECSLKLKVKRTSNTYNPMESVKQEILTSANMTTNKDKPSILRLWEKKMGFETELIWTNVISISLFHVITVLWTIYHLWTGNFLKWQSVLFSFFIGQAAGFGVTGGAHRYWCHRSYKATLPLQWILIICYSMAGQNTIPEWVRDHRVHHKHSETSADPHNANRGFFFAHVGWLMMKKHPDVIRKGRQIDMSDVTNDPLVQFHTKHFSIFKLMFCFLLPTLVGPITWGESWENSILCQAFVRYMMSLNFTWSVNSFAHLWGNKPYDPNIMPTENWAVSALSLGEGWHNYHHTFPWDYKAAELAYYINVTTLLLDGFAKLGWAYQLKQASPELVRAVTKNRNRTKS